MYPLVSDLLHQLSNLCAAEQSAELNALNLVVVRASPTVGVCYCLGNNVCVCVCVGAHVHADVCGFENT